ncbi:Transcriptional activator protein Anr [Pandoraea eparura]|jgi:CRP/FNR family transcriptional regulator|uniref:Transcriptional activator protein Anr n=1 Tax=Pandoraea eparura TaxID=2508291 RepID=A0A5E4XIH0_9BURK|nr:fumarate/nitrate reduction transcriptional regulator Fnr [Pandoraea eparura]VVE36171.1 Transcriptional activator protein Anr [Pandoraea eparura]
MYESQALANAGHHFGAVDAFPMAGDAASRALIAHPASQCGTCVLRHLCVASTLNDNEAARLKSVVRTWRMVRQGHALYRAGDAFQSLYAVRSGSFKTVAQHSLGRQYVSGFSLPGDLLGLDGIVAESHPCDAFALEDSAVCVIPFQSLEVLCRELSPLQQHVHRLMSAEIVRETAQMVMLGSMTADQRVAAFLLNLSSRFALRGYSPREFTLRMTREDMGSHLGMKLETVSRSLSRFQRRGLILVSGKRITLLNREALGTC